MLSKTPQSSSSKILEVHNETFTFETPDEIEDDLLDFYYENWHKEHETEFQSVFNKGVREILEHHLGKLFVLRDSSGEVAAISLPDQIILDDDKEGLGTVIVEEKHRRKGLSTYLSNERINVLIKQDPNIKKINVTAESIEGFQCVLSLQKKIKELVDLDINYTSDGLEKIIDAILNKFQDEITKDGWFGIAQDLRDEKKLTIDIPKDIKNELFDKYDVETLDDMVIDDILTHVFTKNGVSATIDLFKTTDKEELREKLTKIGIVITLPKK